MKYKNIIFDVGGVLLDYDWQGAMVKAGAKVDNVVSLGRKLLDDPVWKEFDLGIRPYDDVMDELCNKYSEHSEIIRYFLTHVENMPLPRPKVWEEVHRIKEKGYRLFILSNYCQKMFDCHAGTRPFIKDMDGIMVSYMVHVNKPDAGIYEALLEKYNLNPKESIFFDDKEENTEAARRLGIDAVTITSEECLLEELHKL